MNYFKANVVVTTFFPAPGYVAIKSRYTCSSFVQAQAWRMR